MGLKLCPFCGCEAQTEFNVVFGFQVICTNEDCFMNEALMHDKKTEQDAIETWNRRAKIHGGGGRISPSDAQKEATPLMDINDTIKAFRCCVQIPPVCAECPQQGPGFGIVCKQNVKDSVLYWLIEAKEAVEHGKENEN